MTDPIETEADESAPREVSKQFLYTTLVKLETQVSGLVGTVRTLTQVFDRFHVELVDVKREAQGMGAAVMAARKESIELLKKFEAMVIRVEQEIKAAYRAGQEGIPLENVPSARDRDTEPPPPPPNQ